jgi:hypothetical protein
MVKARFNLIHVIGRGVSVCVNVNVKGDTFEGLAQVVKALNFGCIIIKFNVRVYLGANNLLRPHPWRNPDLI